MHKTQQACNNAQSSDRAICCQGVLKDVLYLEDARSDFVSPFYGRPTSSSEHENRLESLTR